MIFERLCKTLTSECLLFPTLRIQSTAARTRRHLLTALTGSYTSLIELAHYNEYTTCVFQINIALVWFSTKWTMRDQKSEGAIAKAQEHFI